LLNIQGTECDYQFSLTAAQVALGQHLLKVLDGPDAVEKRVAALHDFFYPFTSKRDIRQEYSKWFDALECFIAIYCLKADGNYEDASGCTQLFAILKYICRGTTLYEAFNQFSGDTASSYV